MNRRFVLLSAATIVAGATVLGQGQTTGDALDPVRVAADTHRVAFENAFVRILEVRIPAGKTEPRHRHPHGLSVYFSDWEPKVTVDGKPAQVNARKSGTFAWSDAVVHTVENVGKTEGRVLRIELKVLNPSQLQPCRDRRAMRPARTVSSKNASQAGRARGGAVSPLTFGTPVRPTDWAPACARPLAAAGIGSRTPETHFFRA